MRIKIVRECRGGEEEDAGNEDSAGAIVGRAEVAAAKWAEQGRVRLRMRLWEERAILCLCLGTRHNIVVALHLFTL